MNTCPFCLNPIAENDEVVTCGACAAVHHSECWAENGGCCVRDCKNVSRTMDIDIVPEGSDRLVLSREAVEAARWHKTARSSNPCIRCGKQVPNGQLHCPDCRPEPQESHDAKNLGPILIVLALLLLIAAWPIAGAGEHESDHLQHYIQPEARSKSTK